MDLQFAEFMPIGRKAVLLLKPPDFFLNHAMCEELTKFLQDFPCSDFDGLVITGKGKHFCMGVDIGEHLPEELGGKVKTMLPAFHKLLLEISQFKRPIVAAIHGSVMGGGLEFARACHRVIACTPKNFTSVFRRSSWDVFLHSD